jgi:hypothetical protein
VLIACACSAAPARASDHLLKINEIFVGSAGGPQFVELLDEVAEPFAAPPYKLVVHNSSGGVVGKVTLPEAELAATGTSPYLVANAAQGGTPNEPLTVTLPGTGQLCFTRGAAEARIHCVSYGCPITSPFPSEGGSATVSAMFPSSSAQRQANGSFGVGPPTPDAANTLHPMVPCGTPAPPGGNPLAADRTKPVAKLGGKRRQRLRKLSVAVTVNENATVRASGSVRIGKRKLAIKKVKRSVRAGKKVILRLRLSRRARTSVMAALLRGTRARATVSVTATDAARNSTKKKRTIRVLP